jgi:hypothetical protein
VPSRPRLLIKQLDSACAELRKLRGRVDIATGLRDELILRLISEGLSYGDISAHSGLTRGRIAQIARHRRDCH